MTKKNGMTALIRVGTLIPEILDPTKRFTPNGGVIKPIDNVTIMPTPK